MTFCVAASSLFSVAAEQNNAAISHKHNHKIVVGTTTTTMPWNALFIQSKKDKWEAKQEAKAKKAAQVAMEKENPEKEQDYQKGNGHWARHQQQRRELDRTRTPVGVRQSKRQAGMPPFPDKANEEAAEALANLGAEAPKETLDPVFDKNVEKEDEGEKGKDVIDHYFDRCLQNAKKKLEEDDTTDTDDDEGPPQEKTADVPQVVEPTDVTKVVESASAPNPDDVPKPDDTKGPPPPQEKTPDVFKVVVTKVVESASAPNPDDGPKPDDTKGPPPPQEKKPDVVVTKVVEPPKSDPDPDGATKSDGKDTKRKRKVTKRPVGTPSKSVQQVKDAVVRIQAAIAAQRVSNIQAMTSYATERQTENNPRSTTLLVNIDEIVPRPDMAQEGERQRVTPMWTLLMPKDVGIKEMGAELEMLGLAMQRDVAPVVAAPKASVVRSSKRTKKGNKLLVIMPAAAEEKEDKWPFDFNVVTDPVNYLVSIYGEHARSLVKKNNKKREQEEDEDEEDGIV